MKRRIVVSGDESMAVVGQDCILSQTGCKPVLHAQTGYKPVLRGPLRQSPVFVLIAAVGLLIVGLPLMNRSSIAAAAPPSALIVRKTADGTVVGYRDTPLLPATGGKYHVHDPDRPLPRYVETAPCPAHSERCRAPSDAVILFSGTDLGKWKNPTWQVESGALVAGHGSIETKDSFGDIQLHLEWMVPREPANNMMNRGNSGVLLMGLYELQIFDSHPSHSEQIYPDGQAASIYGQTPPLVNACRPPGEWQVFDIVFTAPEFSDGKLAKPAFITVFHNGVLVHLNQPIIGQMAHRKIIPYSPHAARMPLVLQGHSSPVRFRNIWVRNR